VTTATQKAMKPASFRGVRFVAIEVGTGGGRRVVVDEYPLRDTPSTQDLGRAARKWTLRGVLVSSRPDVLAYEQQRLRDAFDAEGPGTLVHPRDGALQVQCTEYELLFDAETVNKIEFSASFVEAGTVFAPVPPPRLRAPSWGDLLRAAVRTAYAIRGAILSAKRKVTRLLVGSLRERLQAFVGLIGQFTGVNVADFEYAINVAFDAIDTIQDDVAGFADAWSSVMEQVRGSGSYRAQTVNAEIVRKATFASWESSTADHAALVAAGAPADSIEAARVLVEADAMMYATALADTAEAAAQADYATYDDAAAVLSVLGEAVAGIGDILPDAQVESESMIVHGDLIEAIRQAALDLPRLRTLTLPGVASALPLAFDLYGDPDRADDIVSRNGIADPLAVSGRIRVESR